MNFKQIETFYWAAKLGSFTAAAARLNATQSTVSMRIQDLESSFGVALFDRSQRSARITAKGRELMRFSEQLLHLSAEIRESLAETDTMTGTVRLGFAEVVSSTWLPELVKTIHERYPRIVLELDEALTQDLVERLRNGSLDVILAPGRVPGYTFTAQPLGAVEFAWMASPSLELPDGKLSPKDLQRWPVIALSRESIHHTTIEDWFRSGNAHCRRIDTCKSLVVAASLAAAGLGVTLLPPRCFAREIRSGELRVVPTDPPLTAVEFTATSSVDSLQPVARHITELARVISDFDKQAELELAAE